MKVFIGYDPIDDKAFKVCEQSLRDHATIPVEVIKVWDHPLRRQEIYWRTYHAERSGQLIDDQDGKPFSTAFSFARFAVPIMAEYTSDLVLFMDADMMWRGDIADLLDDTYAEKALWCVQHDHVPEETSKMYGCQQTQYFRKNWSSFMLMRPSLCHRMNTFRLNHWTGAQLHGLQWLNDDEIGSLDERWNWLEGWSDPAIDPKVAHFTRGTPDMAGHEDVPYAAQWWETYHAALESDLLPASIKAA